MAEIDMALVERINTAIRSVNIRFGPNALAIIAADGTVPLSQGESWHIALAVADELGDDLDWKERAEVAEARDQLAAAGLLSVPQSPGARELPCSLGLIRTFQGPAHAHHSHTWAPQPGVTPVWCPGISAEPPTPVGTSTATPNELPASVGTWHTLGHCPDQSICPLHPLPGGVLETTTKET